MNLNKLKYFYGASPLFIKIIYSYIPFSLRNGKKYRHWRNHLNSGKSMNRNPLASVKYAYKNFRFYRSLYNSINLENWEDIPLLTKSQIQDSLKEFENRNISKFYVNTGGVTGKPAKFYQSNNVWYKELAYVYNYFKIKGYTPGMVKASFRGGDFSNLKKNKYWIKNPNFNELHFSPFHLNETSIFNYVNMLNKIKPKYYHGYPSAFMTLAKLMLKTNLKLNYKPNSFFLISEGFKHDDIDFLQSFFKCKMNSFYGHSERLIFAIADEHLENYTPNLDYGYMELVDKDGKVIKENEILGEIVGTSYDNFAMPLIRYKTGDYTSYIDFDSKKFGPIKGKWGQTCLLGRNNEEISLTALNLHSEELDGILKVQFIQIRPGEINILAMFADERNSNQIERIEKLLSTRVGGLINFKVKITNNFKLSSGGKAPLIVNEFSN